MTVVIGAEGEPFEVVPGGGDLTYSSAPYSINELSGAFYDGRPVSYAKVFATQPWVAIAVMRLLTWAVRVPLKAYRRLDAEGDRERLRPNGPDAHPLARALAYPWARGSQADLVMSLLGPMCVHGNALTGIEDGARGALRFNPIDWRMILPIREAPSDPYSEIVGWTYYKPGGGRVPYSADRVLHLRWWSPLGNLGVSPLQQLRSTITSETAAVEWTINNLKQSWRPNGLVELSDAALGLNPDDRFKLFERAKKELSEAYAGQLNAGKLPVIPPGLKWTKADQTTAVEAELVNQRMWNRNEVAAIYQLPPPTIGQLERATFNNVAELRQMAYTDGLAPPLVVIEQAINAHVIHELLREDDIFVEFDLGLILRGDRLKEIKALREGVGMGIYTPNEARGALNLPQDGSEAADRLYLPLNNLSPLGTQGEGNEP